jgi:serine/threonine-protein kinase
VAASFAHPNVVTVYDFGSVAETRAFLVMELLEGATLREELHAQPRSAPGRVVEIMRGVCAAVQAAHRRHLVHRDLKPENIFLSRGEAGEVPKVLDFGVAKFLPAADLATADTQSGMVVGTLAYMAPEQLRGQPVDPAWDLWALAVVTYEMLTGVHPFVGPAGADYNAVLMGRFTPLATYLQESPTRWQQFLERALHVDPARRPNSAQTFFSELERALA